MKEINFNLHYLYHKTEFWIALAVILGVNALSAALSIFTYDYELMSTMSADYQFILNNVFVNMISFVILIIPVAVGLVFADSGWLERQRKTENMLYTRLDLRKNCVLRYFMTMIVSFFMTMAGFLLNYLILYFIYGSGNRLTYAQDLPFAMLGYTDTALNTIFLSKPMLAVLVESILVSLVIALLSGLCYTLSYFIQFRLLIIIYVLPFVILMASELVMTFMNNSAYSLVQLLQPFLCESLIPYAVVLPVLFLAGILLLYIVSGRRDIL